MTNQAQAFVSVNWLNEQLQNEDCDNLILLDATLAPVGVDPTIFDKRPVLPGAFYFEIDGKFSDNTSQLPHTLLHTAEFELQAQTLGINQNSIIVVYDAIGVYSAPRAWWNFKIYGHEQVYILNGGLPAWQAAKLPTQAHHQIPRFTGNFLANTIASRTSDKQTVLAAISDSDIQILDARGQARFLGQQQEPRAGMRSGHMPGALNLPYANLVIKDKIAADEQLADALMQIGFHKDKHTICSCGSGITACILLAALWQLGQRDLSLYDGSWSEWGGDSSVPIATE